ncbi:peptide-binding protein [Mesorhizobium sp. LNJC386A00]|nr:peptide-binding protein [Mesorhizobium sp. LNJC386A00]ESY03981.1 peptide-binding protein [Mesorhizobium sp. LNJC398B00]ESY38592.1 peptide-binding protein [Mesorhizobium sp. LNJC386A00]
MMRRTIRTILHRLTGAPLLRAARLLAGPLVVGPLLVSLPANAEDAPADIVSIVTELGPGDLLNIRATPSPVGRTQARLPIGSSVRNFGCNEVDGHRWCKVEEIDNPLVKGWAPARYLIPDNPTVVEVEAAPPQVTASAEAGGPTLAPDMPTQPADVAAAPRTTAPAASAAPAAPTQAPPTPAAPAPAPLDLTERLGGTNPGAPKSAAEIGRTAMQDAYGLAFAANESPPTGEIAATEAPATETTGKPVQDSAANAEVAPDATSAPRVPSPTPRPDQAKAATATQTVARLEPPPALGATAEIPCARYVGQPMTRCAVNIVHNGADKADITVTWPDGGTRVISFSAGMPANSDSPSEFRFTREGSLNMIRIGAAERFEITDQLALGD